MSRVTKPLLLMALAGATLTMTAGPASAAPLIFTDRPSWEAAILAFDAGAAFGIEDFTGLLDDHGRDSQDGLSPPDPMDDGVPIDGNGRGVGPHSFGGGGFEITLNDIGDGAPPHEDFGGSMSGIRSEEFLIRLVHDSSDFTLVIIPGVFELEFEGEGVESATFDFTDTDNIAFAAIWGNPFNSGDVSSHDGVIVDVNGSMFSLGTELVTDFFGVVDTDGLSSFSLLPDDLLPLPTNQTAFQELTFDNFEFASGTEDGVVPVPEPTSLALLAIGLIGLGGASRRRWRG